MIHISSVMNWLAIGRHHADMYSNSIDTHRGTVELENTIELDSNDATAVMAYSEAIENMAINYEVIDSLLIEEMTNAIDDCQNVNELLNSQQISKALLPAAREFLHNFYTSSKKYCDDHEDIFRSAHEECDFDLLKSLTHVFAKTFIKWYYKQQASI